MPDIGYEKERTRLTSPSPDACYHCGDRCPTDAVRREDKVFCCTGCATVYDILQENGLCRYYDLDAEAGISMRGKARPEYAYLDEPGMVDRLADFRDGERVQVRFYLPQIHCASCIWLLEKLYAIQPGIERSKVHFLKKEISLAFRDSEISLREVVELLASLGYAPSISFDDLDKAKRPVVDRRLFYQLGVAGFAFGNIMLLSFPEYLGLEQLTEARFAHLFGLLNILLALPVVFYSGQDYLRSAFQGLRRGMLTLDVPIALGMLTLFGRSTFEILSGQGAGYLDSLAGLVFFLLVGRWFQQRTFHHISFERDFRSYFPIAARQITEAGEQSVSLDRLAPGQRIRVLHQELVPADSVLLRGEALVDYSFVTGESEPVSKGPGEKIFAGGRQVGGAIELQLTRRVSNSYLTQLWNDAAFTKETSSRAKALADRVGKAFTGAILLIATLTLLYWLPRDMATAMHAFTSVLIIACPCAVALAIPFIFGNAIRLLGARGFYLKNTLVIEGLNRFDATVLDKTGTLTRSGQARVRWSGEPLTEAESASLLALTAPSAHPISRSIHDFTKGRTDIQGLPELQHWQEHLGAGLEASEGARRIQLGSPAFLGCPGEGVGLAFDGTCRGWFQLERDLRPGLTDVLEALRKRGPIWLLSGDNARERSRFADLFGTGDQLRFQQSPHDKLRFVRSRQEAGRHVLMVGDGLNDAGALKQSDTGIVVADNTNNFTPACDAVLRADRFGELPRFLEFARGSIRLVYLAYGLALIYNVIGLSFAVQGLLSPVVAAILMPASSITIALFGLLSSNGLGHLLLREPATESADSNNMHPIENKGDESQYAS